jgi:hypothetical protein
MKILLLLPLLFLVAFPQQTVTPEKSPVSVVSFKVSRSHRTIEKGDTEGITPPASAMIPANKNFARNVRANDPAGVRDPNADTLDGRSAQLEKSVQEARTPQSKQVDGYAYRIKVQNTAANAVEIIFWEYQFMDARDATSLTRHQFLCGVNIRPGKDKELEGFSQSNPSSVINVDGVANKESNPAQEKIVINRVEFADGTIWQRKDWSLKEVKASYERALKEPWVPGMCKGL